MSTTSILSVIQHYQRSIEKCQTDEARLLHCISKLYNLPVQVEHLQETGIGKTVNSLRKFDGEIGTAAKTLVAKWKSMVAAAEQPIETPSSHQDEDNNNRSDEEDDDDDDKHLQRSGNVEINGYEQHNQSALESAKTHNTSGATSRERERDHSKKKHEKERSSKHGSSSDSRHKSSSSSSAAAGGDASSKHKSKSSHSSSSADRKHNEKHHKEREEKGKSEHRHEQKSKERDGSERRREDKHKSSSSSHKSSSGSSAKTANTSIEEHAKKEKPINTDADKRSSSSSTKDKDGKSQKHEHKHDKHKSSSSSSKDRSDRESNEHRKHSSKSSTKTKDSSDAAAASSAERKRRHNSDQDSNDSKSPTAKVIKHTNSSGSGNSKPTDEKPDEDDEGIDSSMGANFSDVLGMLNMPSKKSKKTSNAIKTAIAAGPAGYTSGASAATSSAASSSHAKGSSSGAKESKSSSTTKQNGVRTSFSAAANYSSTRRDEKPDLLSSSAKLEPLDPSIALDLPAISTNYKPMPLNQTVMDCVYAQSSSYTNPPKPVRSLTDAEAYSHGISSKTMRTKIYSGVRTGQILQVPSLFDLCIRVLQKNIDALEYTGGVPFDVLRPVLERASPHQLLVFEEYNPYLMEDSDVLWQHHVQRHYRAQKRQEMESWREMFLRCQDAQERKLNILAESIKQSQKIIAAPVRKTQLAFVDSMVKPPRNVQRKQEQFGTKSKMIATPAARVAALSSVTPNAAKTGDARLRVAASVRDHAQVSNVAARSKKAPLMAKTLQFMRRKR